MSDRVTVTVAADGPVADAVTRHGDYVAGEVLAAELSVTPPGGAIEAAHALTIDGHPVHVSIARA